MKNFLTKIESAAPWLLFFLLASFTYAYLFDYPYLGFQFSPSSGSIKEVYFSQGEENTLKVEDQIISIGADKWENSIQDYREQFPKSVSPGERVSIIVVREQEQVAIEWFIPGFNLSEFLDRLVNTWWFGYIFWFFGMLAMLLLRPRSTRRNLMVAFCFVTAIWLVTGTVSRIRQFEVVFVMRAAIWMSMPIYIHFHWHFPYLYCESKPFTWWSLYALGFLGAIFQWLGLLDSRSYLLPFAVALIGSAALMILRFIRRPSERSELRIILLAALVAFSPALFIALTNGTSNSSLILPGLLISMGAIPGAYYYLLFRRQLGGMELRANRLVSLYLYIILVITVLFTLMGLIPVDKLTTQGMIGLSILLSLGAVIGTIISFDKFQRAVERKILNMPLAKGELNEGFSREIATSLTLENLEKVIAGSILPSLLIRKSAIVQFGKKGEDPKFICATGLKLERMPLVADLKQVRKLNFGQKSFHEGSEEMPARLAWVRLIIPFSIQSVPSGYWLFGRRDPDDIYSGADIVLLQVLADQVAIALINIEQAKQLRTLYQMDIDRQESERKTLARELHDDAN